MYLYELPDFCPLNSPDLNTFISKYGAASLAEKKLDVDDLRQKLIDVRVGVDPDIYISQGSVVTCLRCGGIFNDSFITRLLPSLDSKRILKIGQHLLKLLVVF